VYLKGTTAEAEMFAMLPYAAAVLLAVKGMRRTAGEWFFCGAGVLGAIAFFYKAVFMAPVAVTGLMIGLQFYLERRTPVAARLAIRRLVSMVGGFTLVTALVVGYFSLEGLLGRFLMVFSSGSRYVGLTGYQPVINILLIPIYVLAVNNLLLVIFGIAGAVRMVRSSRQPSVSDLKWDVRPIGLVTWLGLSVLTAGITRVDYPHYSLIVVPALAVLSAYEMVYLVRRASEASAVRARRLSQMGLAIVFLLTLLNSALTNYSMYAHYIRYRQGIETYAQFLEKGTFEGGIYLREQALADYITERTDPDDRIYHWTDFPQIYYLADRRSPIDTIWPTQVELSGSYQRIFGEQTRYILVGSSLYLPVPAWMQAELDKAYRLETTLDGQAIYRRIEP
jgi:hypothetical protein